MPFFFFLFSFVVVVVIVPFEVMASHCVMSLLPFFITSFKNKKNVPK
jgi:hypothetical protein